MRLVQPCEITGLRLSPSSDQYDSIIITKNDGSIAIGRIINLVGDSIHANTNLFDPGQLVSVDRKLIKDIVKNPNSMMPPALLYTLTKDDILDLFAHTFSHGDRNDPRFQ